MKHIIKIQSDYKYTFSVYVIKVVTNRGIENYGLPTTSLECAQKKLNKLCNKIPFYDDVKETTIYNAIVAEQTISVD